MLERKGEISALDILVGDHDPVIVSYNARAIAGREKVKKGHHKQYFYLVIFVGDHYPVIVGDDALVQGEDSLVRRLQPTNLRAGSRDIISNIYV